LKIPNTHTHTHTHTQRAGGVAQDVGPEFKSQYYKKKKKRKKEMLARRCWLTDACSPSYLGGRDQEDPGSKPAWANILRAPISKKPITKKGWWRGSRFSP
jgi:hypothetical protein